MQGNAEKYQSELKYWMERYFAEGKTFRNSHYEKLMLAMSNEPNEDFLKDKIVVDFGCGPRGSLVWTKAPKLRIGVDVLVDHYFDIFGEEMVNDGYPYVKSTEKYIPLPSGFADVVFTMNAMDHTENFEVMLSEIFRVLKPGGDFIGSFNMNEPATLCEPHTLTFKMMEKLLFPRIDIICKETALKGNYLTPPRETYDGFFDISIRKPTEEDTCILWIRGKKKTNKNTEINKVNSTINQNNESQLQIAKNNLSHFLIENMKKMEPWYIFYETDKSNIDKLFLFRIELIKKALSFLYPSIPHQRCNISGLEIFNRLQDEESRIIYRELFCYHHLFGESEINKFHFHYTEIIRASLFYRIKEKMINNTFNTETSKIHSKGNELWDHLINDAFFLGEQYFSLPTIKAHKDEVFIDGGAAYGDTLVDFLSYCKGNYKHIYCFEPKHDNFSRLSATCKELDIHNITLINKGLYNENTTLSFSGIQGNFHVTNNGNIEVPVVCLDSVLPIDEKVTYIKLDVEGSDLEALIGARDTIIRCKPRIAVCIYHKPAEDIINIPAYLLSLVPEYKFYIRHYSYQQWETVLYATI